MPPGRSAASRSCPPAAAPAAVSSAPLRKKQGTPAVSAGRITAHPDKRDIRPPVGSYRPLLRITDRPPPADAAAGWPRRPRKRTDGRSGRTGVIPNADRVFLRARPTKSRRPANRRSGCPARNPATSPPRSIFPVNAIPRGGRRLPERHPGPSSPHTRPTKRHVRTRAQEARTTKPTPPPPSGPDRKHSRHLWHSRRPTSRTWSTRHRPPSAPGRRPSRHPFRIRPRGLRTRMRKPPRLSGRGNRRSMHPADTPRTPRRGGNVRNAGEDDRLQPRPLPPARGVRPSIPERLLSFSAIHIIPETVRSHIASPRIFHPAVSKKNATNRFRIALRSEIFSSFPGESPARNGIAAFPNKRRHKESYALCPHRPHPAESARQCRRRQDRLAHRMAAGFRTRPKSELSRQTYGSANGSRCSQKSAAPKFGHRQIAPKMHARTAALPRAERRTYSGQQFAFEARHTARGYIIVT